jgi:hypothetical protein
MERHARRRQRSRLSQELRQDLRRPSSPSKSVPTQGKVYTLGWVCKAHDCGDNQLHVLFAPGATQAWGLLTTSGQQKWLGNPDAAIQTAINSNLE